MIKVFIITSSPVAHKEIILFVITTPKVKVFQISKVTEYAISGLFAPLSELHKRISKQGNGIYHYSLLGEFPLRPTQH